MKKRVISIFMAAMMLFSVLPIDMMFSEIYVMAAEDKGYTYGFGTVQGVESNLEEIVIPSQFNGTSKYKIWLTEGTYPKLKSVVVLSENAEVSVEGNADGSFMGGLGYCWDEEKGDYVRIEDFVIWGIENTNIEAYANEFNFTFKSIAGINTYDKITTINPITQEGTEISDIYAGGEDFDVYMPLNSQNCQDVNWISSDENMIKIVSQSFIKENGNNIATAKLKVIGNGVGKCTIKAQGRNASVFETIDFNVIEASTSFNTSLKVYKLKTNVVGSSVYDTYEEVPINQSAVDEDDIYIDENRFVKFVVSTDSESDEVTGYELSDPTAYLSKDFKVGTNQVMDDDGLEKDKYFFYAKSKTGIDTLKMTFLTKSVVGNKTYNVHILRPATTISVDDYEGKGIASTDIHAVVSGKVDMELNQSVDLSATINKDSTDRIECSSSDENVVSVETTGIKDASGVCKVKLNAKKAGIATIVVKLKDEKSENRSLSTSFTVNVTGSDETNSGDTPTQEPTVAPTQEPTQEPTVAPTQEPTQEPTVAPTQEPTVAPTQEPTVAPTQAPTVAPTQTPTQVPTVAPTQTPTVAPTQEPTQEPTVAPTQEPTQAPTEPPKNEDNRKEISDMSPSAASVSYTGSNIKDVSISFSTSLVKGVDYTIAGYTNNVNVGTGKVVIKGIGKYKGECTVSFRITPVSISKVVVSPIRNYVYTGNKIYPGVNATYQNPSEITLDLVKNSDYTLSYSSNKDTGKARITIKGKGNFTGTKNVYFYIIPQNVKNIKQTSIGKNTATIKWSKAKGNVTGYRIWKFDTATMKYKYIASTKNTKYKLTKLPKGSRYIYTVKAYKTSGKVTKYSPNCANVIVVTKPKTVTGLKTSTKNKKVNVKWKKSSNISGYEVSYSIGNGKTVSKDVKTNTYTISAKKDKLVKVKVRAYIVLNGKKYYGSYKTAKKIKVK